MLPPLKAGDQIGGYLLLQNLGKGTLTETWTAKHAKTLEPATLKVFEDWVSNLESVSTKLTAEAEKIKASSHPAIVPLLDYHFATRLGERSFLVMPFIEGDPLHKWLQMKKRRAEEIVKLFLPVMEGLEMMHRQGSLHLNVRPSNILVDKNGRAMLTDSDLSGAFELPRAVAPDVLEYSSPERLAGKNATPASDVYSIACVLLKSLGGQPPAWVTDVHATTKCWIVMPDHASAFSNGLGAIFDRSLTQDPAQRFQSCADLAKALRKWQGGSRTDAFQAFIAPSKSRNRTWIALASAAVAAAFIANYTLTGSSSAVSQSRPTAPPAVTTTNPIDTSVTPTVAVTRDPRGTISSARPVVKPPSPPGKVVDCEKLELELPAVCNDADCRQKKQTCRISEF